MRIKVVKAFPHLPSTPQNESEWLGALASLARYLRSPEGCPWDRKQTSRDFARFLLEEGGELQEALEGSDNAHKAEEWGDALFCLLCAMAAAEDEGLFTLEDALKRAHEKMIRRHDHVFGDNRALTAEQALDSWQKIKEAEKA
jgi:tetrapyrrole methylase family protein/MazG family protein